MRIDMGGTDGGGASGGSFKCVPGGLIAGQVKGGVGVGVGVGCRVPPPPLRALRWGRGEEASRRYELHSGTHQ
jgi:hypothetical protein